MLCYNRRIPIPELEARVDVSSSYILTIGSCVKVLLQKLKISIIPGIEFVFTVKSSE